MGGPQSVGIPSQLKPSWNPSSNEPKTTNYSQYALRSYSTLQNIVANVILKVKSGVESASIAQVVVPLPNATVQLDAFSQILSATLPLFLLSMYILPVYNMVFLIVKEKESKAKESMRMMGLTDLPYWLSWLVYYSIINTVISLIAWAVLCINVITASSPLYLFFFIWLYGQAVFGQIIFLQSLFGRSKFSGMISTVIYFGGSFMNFPVQSATAS